MRHVAFFVLFIALGAAGLFLFFWGQGPRGRDGEQAGDPSARRGVDEALPAPEAQYAPGDGQAAKSEAAAEAAPETGSWTLVGRLLRMRALPPGIEPPPDDAAHREPAEGAAVRVVHHSPAARRPEVTPLTETVAGSDGRFVLRAVPSGVSLDLEIDEAPSALVALNFLLPEPDGDRRTDLGDVRLEPPASRFVSLLDFRGDPVEGGRAHTNPHAWVSLGELHAVPVVREAVERGGGEYVLERLAPGTYSIRASAPGCAWTEERVDVPGSGTVAFRLDAARHIAGTVLTTGWEPVPGAIIRFSGSYEGVISDESGRFLIDRLRASASYVLTATAPGFASHRKTVVAGREDADFWLFRAATVSGQVLSEEDGHPIGRATVELSSVDRFEDRTSARTDGLGRFEVQGLEPGTYELLADHPECQPSSAGRVEIQEGQAIADRTVRLKRGLSLTGTVVDSRTDAPIEDAQVRIESTHGDEPRLWRSGSADAAGAFRVGGLREGAHLVTAWAPGHIPSESRLVAILEEGDDLRLALEAAGSISGRVLDLEGKPLPHVRVHLGSCGSVSAPVQRRLCRDFDVHFSDSKGRYRIDGLPASSSYAVAVYEGSALGRVRDVEVGPGVGLEGVDIRLERPGGAIRGRIATVDGGGIPGTVVTAEAAWNPPDCLFGADFLRKIDGGGKGKSDGRGWYEIAHLEPGEYVVAPEGVDADPPKTRTVDLADGRSIDGVDFTGTVPGVEALSGWVTDTGGSGVPGAVVRTGEAGAVLDVTDEEGRFSLRNLRAGIVECRVGAEGFAPRDFEASAPSTEVLVRMERLARLVGMVRAEGRQHVTGGRVVEHALDDCWTRHSEEVGDIGPVGRFSLDLPPGRHALEFLVGGLAAGDLDVTLAPGETRAATVDLGAGGTIVGKVVLAGSGKRLESGIVHVERPDGSRWGLRGRRDDLDEHGDFSLSHVPEGPVVLVASCAGYPPARLPGVVVPRDGMVEVTIELRSGVGLRGYVRRGDRSVPGALVTARSEDGQLSREGSYAGDGHYDIPDLPPGDYEIAVEAPGPGGATRRIERTMTVEDDVYHRVDIDLEEVLIHGRVVRGGSPVEEARVDASPLAGKRLGSDRTDSSGAYWIRVRRAETYILRVAAARTRPLELELTVPESATEVRRDIEIPAP